MISGWALAVGLLGWVVLAARFALEGGAVNRFAWSEYLVSLFVDGRDGE